MRPQFVANPMNPLSYMQLFPRSMRKYVICYLLFWGFVGVYFIYTGFAVYLFKMAYEVVFGTVKKPQHDILAHFPEVGSDASLVTWSHATNSKKLLHEALHGTEPVMVIESDVLMKGGGTSQQELLPIMAHPPAVDSDLTFDEYIASVVGNFTAGGGRTVGVKLDFKAIEVVELCLQKVSQMAHDMPGPLIVNADILRGPGGPLDKEPIDHKRFLRLFSELTPTALLSIGWTTSGDGGHYGWEHVIPMWELVSRMKPQPAVTFPVRSALLPKSLLPLSWLAEVTGGSLTVWTSAAASEAAPDARVLRRYRAALGPGRVFVDLPGFPTGSLAGGNATADESTTQSGGGPPINASLAFRSADWTLAASPAGAPVGVGGGCAAGRLARLSLQSRLTPPAPTESAPLRLISDAHFASSSASTSVVVITLAGGGIQVTIDCAGVPRCSVTAVEMSLEGGAERQHSRAVEGGLASVGPASHCWYSLTLSPSSLDVEVSFFRRGQQSGSSAGVVRASLRGLLPRRGGGHAPVVAIGNGTAAASSAEGGVTPIAVCHLRLV